jgi:hypothetical protein
LLITSCKADTVKKIEKAKILAKNSANSYGGHKKLKKIQMSTNKNLFKNFFLVIESEQSKTIRKEKERINQRNIRQHTNTNQYQKSRNLNLIL